MKIVKTLLLFLLIIARQAVAQQYEGMVKTVVGKPLPKVSVVISDSLSNPLTFVRSDADGHFLLKVKQGQVAHRLTFTAVGYAKKEVFINDFTNGSTIQMEEKALELREVTVEADKVIRNGDTITYRVSGFKQDIDRSIEDVIKRMPGLRVDKNGTIYVQNRAIRNFYIEGMDMMGNSYAQASRNISADRVESVQVYEHHEPVKALQGMAKSDEVALNIKLKNNIKNIWTGSGDIALGTPVGDMDKLLREWKITPMLFARNLQSLSLYKSNNIGVDLLPESGNTYIETERNPVDNISYGTSFADRRRSLFNDSHLLTTNWLYKPRQDTDLRLQLAGYVDHETGFIQRETHYINQEGAIRTEQNTSDSYRRELNANLKYERNAQRNLLSNQLAAHIDFNHSKALSLLNGRQTEQNVEPHDFYLNNQLNTVWRIAQRQSLNFTSTFTYANLPGTLHLYNDGTQETTLRSLKWTNQLSTHYNWKRMMLTLSANGSLMSEDFNVSTPDTIARNSYHEASFLLRPAFFYGGFPWRFSLTPKLRLLRQSLEHDHQYRTLFEPEVGITYDNDGAFRHNLSFLQFHSFSQLTEMTDIPFYRNYAFASAGTGKMRLTDMKMAYLTSSWRDLGHLLSATASLNFTRMTTNKLYGSQLDSDGLYNRTTYDKKNHADNLSASGEIQKNFSWASAAVSMKGSYGISTYHMMTGREEMTHRMYNSSLSGSFSMRPIASLLVNAGMEYNARRSRQNNKDDKKQIIENYVGHLNIHFTKNRFQSSLTNWCSLNSSEGQNNVWFTDLKVSYLYKKMEFVLRCNNIWNTDKMIRRGISIYEETFSIYRLRPRELLLGVNILM